AALFLAPTVATGELLAAARSRRDTRLRLETFSPLYMTNECDAECRMCGMRGTNTALVRETADDETMAQQLALLRRRGMRAPALLTGEYRGGARRARILARGARALRAAVGVGLRPVPITGGAARG